MKYSDYFIESLVELGYTHCFFVGGGNVMHLLPMSLEELNLHIDNSHELSRDAMLEKIILLSVSYFCVGTELRFLSSTA